MTKEEMLAIMGIVDSCYPGRFGYSQRNSQDRKIMLQTWYTFLQDYEYKLVEIAVYKLAADSQYPPSVNDILSKIEEVENPDKLTTDEAWEQVLNAIDRHGRYRPKEAFEMLTPAVKKAVQLYGGWDRVCSMEIDNEFAVKQFKDIFRIQQEKQIRQNRLPESIKKEMLMLGGKNQQDVDSRREEITAKFTRQLNPSKKEVG